MLIGGEVQYVLESLGKRSPEERDPISATSILQFLGLIEKEWPEERAVRESRLRDPSLQGYNLRVQFPKLDRRST